MRCGHLISLCAGLALLCDASVWAANGRTPGNFAVSSDGSANYTIPIKMPPGVAGLQPSLSLNYNSRSGDGLLGVGWSLSGLSAITRCNLTYAQDGVVGSPQLNSGDRFCLDGNRLRTTNGSTYGAAGATYQTEIANFANITSNGSAGNGPAWFQVQGRNGLTYEYGNTADSAILATGSSAVRVWALNAVRDRNGNAMTYTYSTDTPNGSYRLARIQYTYTGSSTTNNGYSLVFTYQARPSADMLMTNKMGGVVNQLNYLNQITVTSLAGTATMVHGYALTYVTAPTTSRLRISSIQECASSFTDCFPATTIAYQDGQVAWGAENANSGNLTNMAFALPIDVNGDGIDDIVYPDPASGHWFYALGTTSGVYSGPYDTGVASTNYQSALAIDFYANGRKEILVPNASNNWRIIQFVSAGAAFSIVDTTTSAAGVVQGSAMVGDVDGDGREDLIYAVSGGAGYGQSDNIYYRLNTGGAFSTTQGTLASFTNGVTCSPCVKLGNSAPFGNPAYRFNSQIRKLDFNGDGRTDFLVYLGSCTPATGPAKCGINTPITYGWTVFLSQPNGTYVGADVVSYTSGSTPNQPPLVGDFNGDGCSDIAYTVNSVWQLQYGTCGRASAATVLGPAVNTGVGFTNSPTLAIDWDGDGRADLVAPNSAGHWAVARSTGSSLSPWGDTGIASESAPVVQVADANGDGLSDLVYVVSNALKTRLHAGVAPDLATSFTDAYGVTYSPSYVTLPQAASSTYTKGSSQAYPQQDFGGPWVVVPSYTASDGIGGTYTITNYYSAAILNLQGRGFEGFQGVRANDSRSGMYDFKFYSNTFPTTGIVTEDDTLQPDAVKAIRTVTNAVTDLTLDGTTNNQRYFSYTSASTVKTYEVGGAADGQLTTTSVANYGTPDSFGNFASISTTVTDNDANSPYLNQQWSTTVATTVTSDSGANWCLNLPTERDVTNTAPGVPSITRHVNFTPDYSHCQQTQQVIEAGSTTYKVTTALGYDSFGNLNSQTVTGVGMAARTTSINWGTSGQFPTSVTNALNKVTQMAFDPLTGQQLSQTDPNGISTSYAYDTFARKTKETRPDGTSTTWAYNNCVTAGCVNTNNHMTVVTTWLNTDNSTQTTQNSYLDGFDRILVTSKLMLNGAYDLNEVQYDNLGRVHLRGFPCTFVGCAAYWTTNTYDILNRLTQSQRPISATNSTLQTTTYTYQGRTSTVMDPQGKVTTKITQVTGTLARTKDHNGYYVNFNRDAFGSVLSVTDSLSNALNTMTYDYGLQAFQRNSSDVDLGTRSSTYDALGEVTAYSDAKGQNFSMLYDALSRPTSRTEPDLTTTWTWGSTAASFNVGKLQSVASASSAGTYSEGYTYDSKGRLSNRTITIPGVGAQAFDYTYNATTGLLSTLAYPTNASPVTFRLTAGYTYQNGILQQIYDVSTPTTIWWQANAMNPRGQITQETTGALTTDPQIVTNRSYDAVTGFVSSILSGVSSGSALQNQAYLYDLVGNVTQRQDNNAGLTENFFYDNLYRLDHSTVGSTTNLQMAYDATGNITSRSDIAGGATWTYDPVRKHAVTQAGSSSFSYSYDPNGNVSARNGTTLGWTSYNFPSSVGTSTESAVFDYGPDRQRWRMFYSGPTGTETTYYATPLFEIVNSSSGTDYRHYLYAGSRPVVLVDRNTAGAIHVRSLLVDHQGTLSALVTDETGSLYVGESFTAYGNRRDAHTWSGDPTSSDRAIMDSATRQGYTFQTVLGSMGLNHFNGRVQDAATGRFLSADPQGIDPANPQSFNRYSYVKNNPLTRVDPSGFSDETPLESTQPYYGGLAGADGGFSGLDEIRVYGSRDSFPSNIGQAVSALTSPTPDPKTSSNSGDSLAEVVVVGQKPMPPQPPPLTLLSLPPFVIQPPQQIPCLSGVDCYAQPAQSQNPCPGANGPASAFRDSAPNNPSLGYTPNNVLPSNAQQVTAPDGTVFNAPPNADFAAVYTYGRSLASIPSPLNTGGLQYASGFGGLFDFQRGNNQFNGNYAYASNYAIGILANGANVSLLYVQFVAGLVKAVSGGQGFPSAADARAQGYLAAQSGACRRP